MIKYPILIFCSQICCLLSIYKLITEARSLMLVNFYLFLLFILGKCNDDFAKIPKKLKSIRKWNLYNRSSSTKNSQMRASWHRAQTSSWELFSSPSFLVRWVSLLTYLSDKPFWLTVQWKCLVLYDSLIPWKMHWCLCCCCSCIFILFLCWFFFVCIFWFSSLTLFCFVVFCVWVFFSFERDFDLMTGLLLLFFLVYFKLAVTIA